jgi:ureidoacrylate peracid hydrolase
VELRAKPEDLKFRLVNFALVVVDMQNAFAKKGGMFDVNGLLDQERAKRVISRTRSILDAARIAGVKVVYLKHVYDKKLSNAGGPDSPNYWKELGVVSSRMNPEFEKLHFLTEGSWDSEVVEELMPGKGDVVITKSRYSGFTNPALAKTLRDSGTRILGFAGIATNICVESTLRDAFFSEFFPVLFEDACMQNGPSEAQETTIDVVQRCFGWTSESKRIVEALS